MLIIGGIAGPLAGGFAHERLNGALEVPIGIIAGVGVPILFLGVTFLALWATSATLQRNHARVAYRTALQRIEGYKAEIRELYTRVADLEARNQPPIHVHIHTPGAHEVREEGGRLIVRPLTNEEAEQPGNGQ